MVPTWRRRTITTAWRAAGILAGLVALGGTARAGTARAATDHADAAARAVSLAAAHPDAAGAGDGHAGLVLLVVLAAAVLVALWRVVLYLLVVATVALGLLGLVTLLAPTSARAASAAASVAQAPPPSNGALTVIVTILLVAAAFLVGLLLGEGWHRSRMARRERQLAEERRRVDALTEALRRRSALEDKPGA